MKKIKTKWEWNKRYGGSRAGNAGYVCSAQEPRHEHHESWTNGFMEWNEEIHSYLGCNIQDKNAKFWEIDDGDVFSISKANYLWRKHKVRFN